MLEILNVKVGYAAPMSSSAASAPRPDPTLTLLHQLFEVSATLNTEVRQVLAEFDLSDTASGLLWMLDPDRPPLRMREIARALGCDPSNVTLLGDQLQHPGVTGAALALGR